MSSSWNYPAGVSGPADGLTAVEFPQLEVAELNFRVNEMTRPIGSILAKPPELRRCFYEFFVPLVFLLFQAETSSTPVSPASPRLYRSRGSRGLSGGRSGNTSVALRSHSVFPSRVLCSHRLHGSPLRHGRSAESEQHGDDEDGACGQSHRLPEAVGPPKLFVDEEEIFGFSHV
jgi:hypothetical protein